MLICVDLDGTLLDTVPANAASYRAALEELIRNEEYVVVTRLLPGEAIERKMKAFKAWRAQARRLLNQSCSMDEAKAALEKGKEMMGEESEEYRALEAKVAESNAWVEKMKEMSEDGAGGGRW